MGRLLKQPVPASLLAAALGLDHSGEDAPVEGIASLASPKPRHLVFAKRAADGLDDAVVLATADSGVHCLAHIIAANPRLQFAKAGLWLRENVGFRPLRERADIHPTARIAPSASIGEGVVIGANSRVEHNVVIADGTTIGSNCLIRSNSVIGEKGFGFERDEDGTAIEIVHVGAVRIGNNVEIGALTAICCGTIDDTIIEDDVKIDNLIHIAHNCIIRKGAMVIACAEISGGVDVGEYAWIGPNASVIQQRKIGDRALVGIAANVLKDIPAEAVVVGNPAKPLGSG